MINLLPPELKEQYEYGRRNTSLRRWATALAFGCVGVLVVTFAGLFLMQQSIVHYRGQVASSKNQLSEQQLDETRAHAKEITGSIKLATDVLSREILFSKLLTQIATVIPSSTSLTDLNISQTTGAIELKAISADYTSATQLQVNLQDPENQIFSKADIQGINCNASASDPRYPCQATIKALFSENNPFLFINKNAKKL
jgi:Tfp pilus assembly protein PilN